MIDPANYIYRYALDHQVDCYLFTGWEVAGLAGHLFQLKPVWFVRKPKMNTNILCDKSCRHNTGGFCFKYEAGVYHASRFDSRWWYHHITAPDKRRITLNDSCDWEE